MSRRVLFFALLAGLVMLPSAAKADALVFTFGASGNGTSLAVVAVGAGGFISNQVSKAPQKATLSTLFTASHTPSGPTIGAAGQHNGTVGFTTGTWLSANNLNPKLATVNTFSGGGNITVTGNGMNGMPSGVLFTGVFNGPVTLSTVFKPHNVQLGTLSAQVTTTFLNPTLLSLLGLPYQSHGTAVAFLLDLRLGVGGQITNGTITLIPEPGTLALFGTGLIGLAGLIRRRLR